jgi:hypothetical protein
MSLNPLTQKVFVCPLSTFMIVGELEIPDLSGGRPVADSDMVLAVKCLSLCELSYKPGRPSAAEGVNTKAIEQNWIQALGIQEFDFQILTLENLVEQEAASINSDSMEAVASLMNALDQIIPRVATKLAGSAAMTGVLTDVNTELPGETPFICFRGTTGVAEMLADLFSLAPAPFESKTKGFIATSGLGMIQHYRELEQKANYLEILSKKAKSTGSNRILVVGHSLGKVGHVTLPVVIVAAMTLPYLSLV